LIHFCTVLYPFVLHVTFYVPCYRPFNKHNTNIHAPGGIRTHDPSKRAAENPRLRPHGHWDRRFEPTIPVSERPQTHALDRAVTGIGHAVYIAYKNSPPLKILPFSPVRSSECLPLLLYPARTFEPCVESHSGAWISMPAIFLYLC
jgi:hypothetical protein